MVSLSLDVVRIPKNSTQVTTLTRDSNAETPGGE
jgi:hypothetical protein